jgi:hypothetical protein
MQLSIGGKSAPDTGIAVKSVDAFCVGGHTGDERIRRVRHCGSWWEPVKSPCEPRRAADFREPDISPSPASFAVAAKSLVVGELYPECAERRAISG